MTMLIFLHFLFHNATEAVTEVTSSKNSAFNIMFLSEIVLERRGSQFHVPFSSTTRARPDLSHKQSAFLRQYWQPLTTRAEISS